MEAKHLVAADQAEHFRDLDTKKENGLIWQPWWSLVKSTSAINSILLSLLLQNDLRPQSVRSKCVFEDERANDISNP